MKITVESTPQIVHTSDGWARVWVGNTTDGKPLIAMISRVGCSIAAGPHVQAEFERDLMEVAAPNFEEWVSLLVAAVEPIRALGLEVMTHDHLAEITRRVRDALAGRKGGA